MPVSHLVGHPENSGNARSVPRERSIAGGQGIWTGTMVEVTVALRPLPR